MPAQTHNLLISKSVVLDSSGEGTVKIGPDVQGPARWRVTGVIVQTNRPGQAPIPRVQVFLDQSAPAGSLGLSYDGSFAQGRTDITIQRGQNLICAWTGGQSGDVASLTVTGQKW